MKKRFYYVFIIVVLCNITACSKPKTDAGEAAGLQSEVPVSADKAETETSPMPDTERNKNAVSTTPSPAMIKTEDTSMVRGGIETLEEYEAARYKTNGELEVSVERTSRPVTNEKGQVLGIVYYERPVVSGDSEAVRKINAFYEREEQEWFDGYGRNTLYNEDRYAYFLESVEIMRERYGDEVLSKDPTRYTINTRIMFLDEKYLSVVQISNWYTEHNSYYYFGSTFDLNTGELLPITDIVDISPGDMKKIIADATYEQYYGDLSDEYVITYYGKETDMRYEYFYDGTFIYIIDNSGEYWMDGIVIRWNKKEKSTLMKYKIDWENERIISTQEQ